jgi:hypothetical protein
MTGTSTKYGGYVNSHGWYAAGEGYGGYTAYRTNHWVFDGTGLSDGAQFGRSATIVGYETDGAPFEWMGNGLPAATGMDWAPLSFTILGVSPASSGFATMGVYKRAGTVFNAATTDWSHGLASDPVVDRITRNVLDSLLGRNAVLLANEPPVLLSPGPMVNGPHKSLDFGLPSLDPELGSLSYAAAGLPPGLSIDPATGRIRGTIARDAGVGSPYTVRVTATDDGTPPLEGAAEWTWTIDEILGIAEEVVLPRVRPAHPNPMRGSTRIAFDLSQDALVEVAVLDLAGRVVARLDPGTPRAAGGHEVTWDGRDERGERVGPGLYVISLRAGRERAAQKVVVIDR